MKTRIIACYLTKEGFNEINERDVDLDEYANIEVKSVEEGRNIIADNEINGIGTIYEEVQREEFDCWETIRENYVDNGEIYNIEIL
jgi:hypothetical protein